MFIPVNGCLLIDKNVLLVDFKINYLTCQIVFMMVLFFCRNVSSNKTQTRAERNIAG